MEFTYFMDSKTNNGGINYTSIKWPSTFTHGTIGGTPYKRDYFSNDISEITTDVINAVSIDWNGAEITNTNTQETYTINTTTDLLLLIQDLLSRVSSLTNNATDEPSVATTNFTTVTPTGTDTPTSTVTPTGTDTDEPTKTTIQSTCGKCGNGYTYIEGESDICPHCGGTVAPSDEPTDSDTDGPTITASPSSEPTSVST